MIFGLSADFSMPSEHGDCGDRATERRIRPRLEQFHASSFEQCYVSKKNFLNKTVDQKNILHAYRRFSLLFNLAFSHCSKNPDDSEHSGPDAAFW